MQSFTISPLFVYCRPGYTKTVPGEGMPITSDPKQRGDLVIEFDIVFPTQLDPTRKEMLNRALLS